MKTIKETRNQNVFTILVTILLICLLSDDTMAQGITKIFEKAQSELVNLKKPITYFFYFAYFCQFLWAGINVWTIVNDKQQGSVRATLMNAGLGLLVTGIINVAAETILP